MLFLRSAYLACSIITYQYPMTFFIDDINEPIHMRRLEARRRFK